MSKIGIAISAANWSAHREENDVGFLHCFRKGNPKTGTILVARLRATSSSSPGSYIGIIFLFSWST